MLTFRFRCGCCRIGLVIQSFDQQLSFVCGLRQTAGPCQYVQPAPAPKVQPLHSDRPGRCPIDQSPAGHFGSWAALPAKQRQTPHPLPNCVHYGCARKRTGLHRFRFLRPWPCMRPMPRLVRAQRCLQCFHLGFVQRHTVRNSNSAQERSTWVPIRSIFGHWIS